MGLGLLLYVLSQPVSNCWAVYPAGLERCHPFFFHCILYIEFLCRFTWRKYLCLPSGMSAVCSSFEASFSFFQNTLRERTACISTFLSLQLSSTFYHLSMLILTLLFSGILHHFVVFLQVLIVKHILSPPHTPCFFFSYLYQIGVNFYYACLLSQSCRVANCSRRCLKRIVLNFICQSHLWAWLGLKRLLGVETFIELKQNLCKGALCLMATQRTPAISGSG